MSDDGKPTGDTVTPAKPGRGRRLAVALLVVIGCVLAPLSVVAVWARTTVLDTDGYVSTVAPLADNPKIVDAAATRVTDRVMSATDLQKRLTEALPPRAAKAAPAMTAAVKNVVYEAATKLLESPRFETIWENANRRVHAQVVATLTGEGAKNLEVQDGEVVVDLTPVANRVRARITELGFDVNAKVPGRVVDPKIVLFRSPYVGWTQDGVKLLQDLAWVLPVLSLLSFAGAVALSRNRRRTLLRSGIGVAIAIAVLLTAINLGHVPYLGLFPKATGREAGGAAYDQVLLALRLSGRAVFALGLVVAIGAWLAGRAGRGAGFRATVSGRSRGGEPGAFTLWVGRAKVGLRVAVIMLGAIALVAVDQPTGLTVLVIAIVVLILLAVIELVGRATPTTSGTA